jgi:hypothetical protein
MVTLYVSHKQAPDDILRVARRFLQENISVTLEPTNKKASKQILKEIESQGITQVVVQNKVIHISP